MPLALDPKERFEVCLESDKDKPPETRPVFVYHYLTGRQWREIARRQDELDDISAGADVADLTYESAQTGLVDWRNMIDPATGESIAFDSDRLDDVVGVIEAQELIAKLLRQLPNREDKKKCVSPSDSATEPSAPTVLAPPTVKIPLAPDRRSKSNV